MPCDYSKYPSNWKTEIRPAILARANNRCEECGVEKGMGIFRGTIDGEPVFQTADADLFKEDGTFIMHDSEYCFIECTPPDKKAIKVVLTISHTDHNITNNEYSNLKALCQLHHLRHDQLHHKKNSADTRNKKKKLQELPFETLK